MYQKCLTGEVPGFSHGLQGPFQDIRHMKHLGLTNPQNRSLPELAQVATSGRFAPHAPHIWVSPLIYRVVWQAGAGHRHVPGTLSLRRTCAQTEQMIASRPFSTEHTGHVLTAMLVSPEGFPTSSSSSKTMMVSTCFACSDGWRASLDCVFSAKLVPIRGCISAREISQRSAEEALCS